MRLGKILLFLWLWALAMGAQAVAAPSKNAFRYDECVSGTSFEYWDQDAQLLYLRARWYDPKIGRFVSADPFEGKQSDSRSLNRYAYAGGDPTGNTDPSGLTNMTELNAGMSSSEGGSVAAQFAVRQAVSKFGCDLAVTLADQAVTYGVYVLFDGVGFYVGQSVDIDRRLQQHIGEAEKYGKNLWKQNAKIVARLNVPGGTQALNKIEQYIVEALRDAGEKLYNKKNVIARYTKNYQLFDSFKKAICRR